MKIAPTKPLRRLIFILARLARPVGFVGHHALNALHYLYLTRTSCLGLLALLLLPFLACGPLRTLVLGAYDVYSFKGAGLIGLMLMITVGCLIHQRKMVDLHGKERFGAVMDQLRPGMVKAWNWLAGIAVVLNVAVVLRASNRDIWPTLLAGLTLGVLAGVVLRKWLGDLEKKFVKVREGFPEKVVSFLVSNGLRPSPGIIKLKDNQQPFEPKNVTLADGHLSALVYGFFLIVIFIVVDEGTIHPLASLLLLISILTLMLGSWAFLLDRHRVPLLALIVIYCGVMNLWRESDHYYPVMPRQANAAPLPTPAAIVDASVKAGRPLVIVAAAGGGIQSAAWTTRVLEQMEKQLAEAGSPGFHDSVRLISGVSGGSVGALQYAHAVGLDGGNPPLDQAARAAAASSLTEAVVGLVKKDLFRATLPIFFTTQDMLFEDRARTLETAWDQNARQMHGGHKCGLGAATLQQWGQDALKLSRPALIFNSTIVETGERMAISTSPRSPLGYLQPPRAGNFEFTERYIADIPMLTAARLSATFPLVSPAARPAIADGKGGGLILPGTRNAGVFPQGGSLHHAVDGGYFENSGLVGALEWLDEALTDLDKVGRRLPGEVLVIELAAFPAPPEDRTRSIPVDLGGSSRGTLFDILSPGLTMMNVRNSSQRAYAGQLLAQFSLRWQLELESKHKRTPGLPFIRHLRLLPPTPKPADPQNDRRGLAQRFADWFFIPADLMSAPLSWHLRPSEIEQINKAASEAVRTMLQTPEILPQTATMVQQQALPVVPPAAAPAVAAPAAGTVPVPAPTAAPVMPPATVQLPAAAPGKPMQSNSELLERFIRRMKK